MDRRQVLLLSIFVIAVLVRLVGAGQSYWLDEAISVKQAREPISTTINLVQHDVHTPLYHVILNAWVHLFNTAPTTVRLLSIVFSIASVYAVYRLGTDHYNSTTGMYAAGFLAVSETMIHYGQEARPYSLLILLTIISSYTYLHYIDGRTTTNLLAYTAANTVLLYTHVFGGLVVIGHAVHYALTHGLKLTRKRTELLSSYIITGILFTPWLPILVNQAQRTTLTWIPPLSVARFIDAYTVLLTSPLIAAALITLFIWQRPRDNNAVVLYTWIITPLLIIATYSVVIRPAFTYRYLLTTVPALYLLIAYLTSKAPTKTTTHIIGLALILVFAASSYYPDNLNRDNWDEVTADLNQREPRPLLIHPSWEQHALTYLYNPTCFEAMTMHECNAEYSIYSIKPSEPCCNDTTALIGTNKTLGDINQAPLYLIQRTLTDEGALRHALNDTGTLHHDATYNTRENPLPYQPKHYLHPITIHSYQPSS